MKKEITIQILGQAGTGKTAFACYIEDHLKELGFKVDRKKDEDEESWTHDDIEKKLIDLIKTSKLHKDRILVKINTVQLSARSLKNAMPSLSTLRLHSTTSSNTAIPMRSPGIESTQISLDIQLSQKPFSTLLVLNGNLIDRLV